MPLIITHFKNRYADQRWIIYDLKRHYGIFYDLNKVEEITLETLPEFSKISNSFDAELQRVILNYTPKERDQEISRQEVIVIPNQQSGDKVETVYTDKVVTDGDSTVQKRLTWQVDKFLQVVTMVRKKNAPETVSVLKVTWNETF